MFELTGDLGFDQESGLWGTSLRPELFDRYPSSDPLVQGQPNLTHAAAGMKTKRTILRR